VATKVIPLRITAMPSALSAQRYGVDAFYLNVTTPMGVESAVVGLTRPEVKHGPRNGVYLRLT